MAYLTSVCSADEDFAVDYDLGQDVSDDHLSVESFGDNSGIVGGGGVDVRSSGDSVF